MSPHHPQVLRDLYRYFSMGPWEASLFLNIPHRLRICLRRCCRLVQADELLWGPAGISHDTCWWGWRRYGEGSTVFRRTGKFEKSVMNPVSPPFRVINPDILSDSLLSLAGHASYLSDILYFHMFAILFCLLKTHGVPESMFQCTASEDKAMFKSGKAVSWYCLTHGHVLSLLSLQVPLRLFFLTSIASGIMCSLSSLRSRMDFPVILFMLSSLFCLTDVCWRDGAKWQHLLSLSVTRFPCVCFLIWLVFCRKFAVKWRLDGWLDAVKLFWAHTSWVICVPAAESGEAILLMPQVQGCLLPQQETCRMR